ncbi:MAG: hypothetical protein A2Y55_01955 [Actinobacteria bacterium RBG_16_68_12]|nr:MAG: hypothetical protein A2Y55_01955 [Actinobacteria bacterium RBG_16_68_12]
MLDLHEPVGRTWNEEQDGCGRLGAHAGLELGLCLALFEPGFSGRKHQLSGLERPLLPFDRRPLQLHRAELATAPREVGLLFPYARLPLGQLVDEAREVELPGVQFARPEAEEPLDRRPRIAQELFPALEVDERLLEARGVLVELAPTLGEHALEPLFRAQAMGDDPAHESGQAVGLVLQTALVPGGLFPPRTQHGAAFRWAPP